MYFFSSQFIKSLLPLLKTNKPDSHPYTHLKFHPQFLAAQRELVVPAFSPTLSSSGHVTRTPTRTNTDTIRMRILTDMRECSPLVGHYYSHLNTTPQHNGPGTNKYRKNHYSCLQVNLCTDSGTSQEQFPSVQ